MTASDHARHIEVVQQRPGLAAAQVGDRDIPHRVTPVAAVVVAGRHLQAPVEVANQSLAERYRQRIGRCEQRLRGRELLLGDVTAAAYPLDCIIGILEDDRLPLDRTFSRVCAIGVDIGDDGGRALNAGTPTAASSE